MIAIENVYTDLKYKFNWIVQQYANKKLTLTGRKSPSSWRGRKARQNRYYYSPEAPMGDDTRGRQFC